MRVCWEELEITLVYTMIYLHRVGYVLLVSNERTHCRL